jgi:hypothetical protein
MMPTIVGLLAYLSCQCPWIELVDCRDDRSCAGPPADRGQATRAPERPRISLVVQTYVRTLVEQRSVAAVGAPPAVLPLHLITSVPLGSTFHGAVVVVRSVSDAVLAGQKFGREMNVVRLTESPPPKPWVGADGTWLLVETGTVQKTPSAVKGAGVDWRFISDGNSEYRVVTGKDDALIFELRSVLAL